MARSALVSRQIDEARAVSRVFWLASYPKSGNTWFRLLVASYRRQGAVDINDLTERHGLASSRGWFDHVMMFPSGLLTHEECDRARPLLYAARDGVSDDRELEEMWTRTDGAQFVKTHDAYTRNGDGRPLMGGRAAAEGVILIVRDPRDVCASLANHNGATLDQAIWFMANPDSTFCGESDRQPNQLRQRLLGWSGFASSWLDQTDLPVHLIHYEDMQEDAARALRAGLSFAGVEAHEQDVALAARAADFAELQRQERERGFREAPPRVRGGFFRRGTSGGWRDELTPEQAGRIERQHLPMMRRLGYLPMNEGEEGPVS